MANNFLKNLRDAPSFITQELNRGFSLAFCAGLRITSDFTDGDFLPRLHQGSTRAIRSATNAERKRYRMELDYDSENDRPIYLTQLRVASVPWHSLIRCAIGNP